MKREEGRPSGGASNISLESGTCGNYVNEKVNLAVTIGDPSFHTVTQDHAAEKHQGRATWCRLADPEDGY